MLSRLNKASLIIVALISTASSAWATESSSTTARALQAPAFIPPYQDPVTPLPAHWDEATAAKIFSDFAQRFESLKNEEAALKKQYEAMAARGETASSLHQALRSATDSGKPELATKLAAEGNKALREVQEAYDRFNFNKAEYFIDLYYARISHLHAAMTPTLKDKSIEKLTSRKQTIDRLYAEYKQGRRYFAQPKDVERTWKFRDCIDQMRLYSSSVEEVMQSNPIMHKLNQVSALAKQVIDTSQEVIASMPELVGILGALHFERDAPKNYTPLSDAIGRFYQKKRMLMGLKIKVTGKENIPALKGPREVNLFAVVHTNPHFDHISLSSMGIRNYATFGAADQFSPKYLADRFDKTNHFIVVGRGSDKPIDKALDILKKRKVRNLVIYPEGAVPIGVFETRPPREKFSWGLLKRLRDEGYKVNVIPVTNIDNMTLMNQEKKEVLGSNFRSVLRTHVDPAITPSEYEAALATGDDQMINRMLRGIWLDRLNTDHDRFLGMEKLDALAPQFESFVLGNVYSRCIRKALDPSLPVIKKDHL